MRIKMDTAILKIVRVSGEGAHLLLTPPLGSSWKSK